MPILTVLVLQMQLIEVWTCMQILDPLFKLNIYH